MMNHEKDPLIQQFFANTAMPAANESFTRSVMGRVRRRKYAQNMLLIMVGFVSIAGIWVLSGMLTSFSQWLVGFLNMPLWDHDLPQALAPMNNVAAIIAVAGFTLFKLWRALMR